MLSRRLLLHARQSRNAPVCLFCAVHGRAFWTPDRPYSSASSQPAKKQKPKSDGEPERHSKKNDDVETTGKAGLGRKQKQRIRQKREAVRDSVKKSQVSPRERPSRKKRSETKTLKEALLGKPPQEGKAKPKRTRRKKQDGAEQKLHIEVISADDLDFQPVDVTIPPIPMLSYGLDRVLFNPGVYRLQDPRSRVYNFDPYLEKIMAVSEFNFGALTEYKTSSKDEDLLALTRRLGTKFTGSTSSMSGVLQHFHYMLSNFRELNHDMLSRSFPGRSSRFSKITLGPNAIFLRWKDGQYAIDADKSYDKPNIMSWLGHSLEKLLTTDRDEFERYRRSNPERAPSEDSSARCYHYSRLGNFLMRSQLDAHDPRLPGSGVFDLKTRAVVSIRMDHKEYETGSGYQLRYDRGEWESFEREFYDMTRATMLKYSLQVRMGRMDGIFVAYHNIERIFGFQYFSLPDLDHVLHGQTDTCLGDQEFKLSVRLLDELLQRATQQFPETTLRLHFEARSGDTPFMYIFAEPVTEERADEIQNSNQAAHRAFERDIVGVDRDDPEMQKEWHDIQDRVDEEVDEDEMEEAHGNEGHSNVRHDKESSEIESDDTPAEASNPDQETTKASTKAADGPLMGWTLAVRNMVNGQYVPRPTDLEPGDSWTIEYHIKEITPDSRRGLYSKLTKRRRDLIGEDTEKESTRIDAYRQLIRRYSERGRKWRNEQDKIDEEIGQQVFRPLGPGAEVAVQPRMSEAAKP